MNRIKQVLKVSVIGIATNNIESNANRDKHERINEVENKIDNSLRNKYDNAYK